MAQSCDPSALAQAASCFQCLPKGALRRVILYLLCQQSNSSSSPVLPTHPTALAWAAQVVVNGGTPITAGSLSAVSTFCYALDNAGLTSLLKVVNVFAPDSMTATRTPLIQTGGNNPWLESNLIPSDLTVNGLKGNHLNKWVEPGIIPSSFMTIATGHGCAYVSEDDITTAQNEYGATSSAADALRLYYHYTDNTTVICFYGNFVSSTLSVGALTGYLCTSRTAANRVDVYYANSLNPHSSVFNDTTVETSGPSATRPMYVLASNENGVSTNQSGKRISFVSFGLGLTSAQSLALFNAVQALRIAFGGGFT